MKWCSDCGRRILGNASDEMPDSEASGELITIAHSAELVALDGEMLSDRSEAGQECLRSLLIHFQSWAISGRIHVEI